MTHTLPMAKDQTSVRIAKYRLRADRTARGHEQAGPRSGVVLTAWRFAHLKRWLVAPTTRRVDRWDSLVIPSVDWGDGPSQVLLDATQSVDPEHRLGEQVGHLTLSELQEVDQALALLLGLPRPRPDRLQQKSPS